MDRIVPDSLGKFSVLSAVGSITLNVVSLSSSVVPSKIKDAADNVDVTVNSATEIVVADILVKLKLPASIPLTSVWSLLNSTLNCSSVELVVTCPAVIAISFYPVKFLT